MTGSVSGAVPLAELCALFTGVPATDGDWSTSPSYSAELAFEIAKRCDAQTDFALRTILYDKTAKEDIPARALRAIARGTKRYLEYRATQSKGRGL